MSTQLSPVAPVTQVTVKNILFPTDFSEASEHALEYAKLLARRYGATIHAVHVFTPDLYGALPAEALSSAVVRMRRDVHERMDEMHHKMDGLHHATFVSEGPLWTVVDHVIENQEIDLIVLGTSARTGVERLLLGSVAEEIFRRSPVPVLTVGPRARQAGEEVHFNHILFATDLNGTNERAAQYAIALAQEYQSKLTLLHVIDDVKGEAATDLARVTTYFSEKLHALVPAEAELWCQPEVVIRCGKPADQILAVEQERPTDLIILGAKHSEHTLAATHFRWPTAAHVVHDADCPVLTVRQV